MADKAPGTATPPPTLGGVACVATIEALSEHDGTEDFPVPPNSGRSCGKRSRLPSRDAGGTCTRLRSDAEAVDQLLQARGLLFQVAASAQGRLQVLRLLG